MRLKRSSEKLNKNKAVAKCRKVSQSVADVAYTDTDTDTDKKEEKKRKTLSFSFEDIWKRYPNAIGKERASSRFKTSIKTSKDWQDINSALDNYKYHLASQDNSWKKAQNGSTWFNNWRDWVDWVEPIEMHSTNNGVLEGIDGLFK